MRTIFWLNVRLVARSIDRSTGSPLGRWVLTAAILALPGLLILAGRSSESFGVSSVSADIANLLIVSSVVGPLVVLSLVIAWRADGRLLEVFRVSPMSTAAWQFALLAPTLALGMWIGFSTAMPIAVDVAGSADLAFSTRVLVLCSALAALIGSASAALLISLALRHVLSAFPSRARTSSRSLVLLCASGSLVWGALRGWEQVNQRIAEHEIAVMLGDASASPAFDIVMISLLVVAGGIVSTLVCVWSALRIPFTPIEQTSDLPLSSLPLSSGSSPALLSVSWLRNPHTASHLFVAALLFLVGVIVPDVRWLAHGAIFLAAAGFVGFAPGNAAMRSIVGVGARRLGTWFLHNGLGALAVWVVLAGGWAATMLLIGEPVLETTVAATLVMALALVVGGFFAHSYRTSFGAELANLVVYCLGAAMVFALIGQDWFSRTHIEVFATSGVVVATALALYTAQSAFDGTTRRV